MKTVVPSRKSIDGPPLPELGGVPIRTGRCRPARSEDTSSALAAVLSAVGNTASRCPVVCDDC